MGLSRVLWDVLLLIAEALLILLLLGSIEPLWLGVYNLAMRTLGLDNPLTYVVHFIYQLSVLIHDYILRAIFHLAGTAESGSAYG